MTHRLAHLPSQVNDPVLGGLKREEHAARLERNVKKHCAFQMELSFF